MSAPASGIAQDHRAAMATEPSLLPRGAVANVLYEELRAQKTQGGPVGEWSSPSEHSTATADA
jgi:hypothetical protein